MSTPDSAIRSAFVARLQAYPGLPAVAWENVPFTPTSGATYLRPVLLSGEPTQAEQGPNGQNWHTGIYQVSIFSPAGVGVSAMNTLRDGLIDHFKRGTNLTYSSTTVVCTKAFAGPAIQETDRIHLPISIRYRALAPN